MNWKCIFFHQWKVISSQPVEVFDDDSNIPCHRYTDFLYECRRCEKFKCIRINGTWTRGDDKDEGAEPPANGPRMSPDEFYELMSKE